MKGMKNRIGVPAIVLLIAAGMPMYGQHLQRNVVGGGGSGMSGGNLNVVATFGQPLAGSIRSGDVTVGQGFWYRPTERGETSGISETGERGGEITLQVVPNPVRTSGSVGITLPETGNLRLVLYDNLGRMVKQLFDGTGIRGRTEIDLDVEQLDAGNYLLILEDGTRRIAEPVVIVR